jgi:hypothetical protein
MILLHTIKLRNIQIQNSVATLAALRTKPFSFWQVLSSSRS